MRNVTNYSRSPFSSIEDCAALSLLYEFGSRVSRSKTVYFVHHVVLVRTAYTYTTHVSYQGTMGVCELSRVKQHLTYKSAIE